MAKMGRPTVENPMSKKVTVKFTEAEYLALLDYAKCHNVSVAQVVRTGVEKYISCTKK